MIKDNNRELRRKRVRAKVIGDEKTPRLTVATSLSHVRAQIIDDTKGTTLVYADDFSIKEKKTKTEKAKMVGEAIASKAKEKKITTVVFDRNRRLYHGRVKELAEAARKAGLKF
jgi:large subunit ribosomal protein L18